MDFMVELHDIVRAGLNATGPAHDAPFALLYSRDFRESGLNFIKGLDSCAGF
jgi:hypothetical protein